MRARFEFLVSVRIIAVKGSELHGVAKCLKIYARHSKMEIKISRARGNGNRNQEETFLVVFPSCISRRNLFYTRYSVFKLRFPLLQI